MIDAFGKPGSYILRGNMRWAGAHSTCLEVDSKSKGFNPSYCWVTIKLENLPTIPLGVAGFDSNSGLPIKTAICMPDSCPGEELYKIFQHLPDILNLPLYSEHINVTDVQCLDPPADILEHPWTVLSLLLLLVATVLVILGTTADYYLDYAERSYSYSKQPGDAGVFWEVLLSFSLPRNGSKILNFNSSENVLPSVHGLRALFVIWAIVANTYFFSVAITDNVLDFLDASEGTFIQLLLKFSLGVDGLFFLSAMGITFYFLTISDGQISQSRILTEYFFRIARMWVPYMVIMLLFFCGVGQHMGGGPFWTLIDDNTLKCQKDWWLSALYINNFKETEQQCMRHAWYMALDMQYYFLMPLILVPLARWAPTGFLIAAIIQGISMAVSGWLTYDNKLPLMIDLKNDRPGLGQYDEYMDILYVKPYYHMGASLIGIICGWTLHKMQRQTEIKQIWVVIGWLVCGACMFFSLFGNTYGNTEREFSVFYHMFTALCFVLGLFWVMVTSVTGNGGPIDWFLNFPFWLPLGRLAYCAFLVHGGWVLVALLNTEVPRHFSYTIMNCYAFSNVVISYFFAFFLSVAFEAPILNIKSYMLQSHKYKRVL